MIGTRLAHYEITALLGKGGMGEVYRATDTKLARDVALKVLPPALAADPERLARFQREAQTLAAIQHPNIASIHGIETVDGHTFLVMELCEGQDLAARLKSGALPVDEVQRIAAQVAAGLEEAHDKGIVHRDLKPANLMLTPAEQVKILDFGLARAFAEGEAADYDADHSPTLTAAFTSPGVILGTAAYMSPEQARGLTVDKRADIWAFGVIVHEMLTGERLFTGETVSDTLAAVLTRDVKLDALPAGVPAPLRHVLARCLERDPRRRLRDIGEARLLLADPEASAVLSGPAPVSPGAPARGRTLPALPWLLLAAAIAVGGLGWFSRPGGDDGPRPVRRFTIDANLPHLYNSRAVEISPDGSRIAVFARDGLWIRDLAKPEMRLLVPGEDLAYTESGITPFWSPDGTQIAYGSAQRLWKIPADGGAPQVICPLPGDWMGGAWGDDGTIVFGTGRGPLYQVAARGGDPVRLLEPEPDRELDFHQPSFVPDGGGFVYALHRVEGVDTIELLRDGRRTVLLRVDAEIRQSVQVVNNPSYSPTGHILYQRDQGNRGLWALPFDARRGEATGEPFLVSAEAGFPSVARDGTLVHMPISSLQERRLVLVGRDGTVQEELAEAALGLSQPALSPDGTRIAYVAYRGQAGDIFVLDRETGVTRHLTAAPGHESDPVWVPGSGLIAYVAPTGDCSGIWTASADGSGRPELLVDQGQQPSFGPAGREVVYTSMCRKERGLMRFVVGEDGPPQLLREHPAGIDAARLSPDGRFLAYRTWESGQPSLEVADYPGMGGRRPMASTESVTRWKADGSEFYYISREPFQMMAVTLDPGDGFKVKATQPLFAIDARAINPYGDFDVTADGSAFVFARTTDRAPATRSFTVVENWFEDFRED